MAKLLEVKDLATYFFTPEGVVKAVDGITYDLEEGEILGLVGESGCGKSVSALSLMRLIQNPGRNVAGSVMFNGQDLLTLEDEDMRHIRGKDMSMIFQEPMTSLNPVLTIGRAADGGSPAAPGDGQGGGGTAGRRAPPHGRYTGGRQEAQGLSSPVQRRYAPEGDDSHGAKLQPQDAHC